MAKVHGGDAGMHMAVKLPAGSCNIDISERAARQNLWIWPLSPFYLGDAPRSGFILSFGSTPAEEIPLAVRKLRNFIDTK
jgi:GntR family transcriptional regulator / MocR family aminotransferase